MFKMLWIREKLSDHHEIYMNHIQDIELHPKKRKKIRKKMCFLKEHELLK